MTSSHLRYFPEVETGSRQRLQTWLDCDSMASNRKKVVNKLKCKVCTKFKARIESCKYFSSKWIDGAESVRTSNVRDHAHSDQHTKAMNLFKKEQAISSGQGPSSYSALAQSFSNISEVEKERLRKKFDISFFVAVERLPFSKYPAICNLERRHGIDVGVFYVNRKAGTSFTHYIAEAKRQDVVTKVMKARFFSLVQDGSTDQGNIENEIILVAWCNSNSAKEQIHTGISYLKILRPKSSSGEGLFNVVEESLELLGITSVDAQHCSRYWH